MPTDETVSKKIESKKARLSATIPVSIKHEIVALVESGAFASESEIATIALTTLLARLDRLKEFDEIKKEVGELRERLDKMQRRLDDKRR